jgi:hypothetical protein
MEQLMRLRLLMLVLLISGCASTEQTEDEVYKRVSGGKLEKWKTLADASKLHWPYALAAVAAYQDADDPHREPLDTTPDCPEPEKLLTANGWRLWENLPLLRKRDAPGSAGEKMRDVHLRAEVWESSKDKKIIVSFGGTAASSLHDWEANFRWALAPLRLNDEYEVLSDVFVPEFIAAYQKRLEAPDGKWLADAQIVAAGHSLGGGLAQRFAYAFNHYSKNSRIQEVYAFDPSPVSGKRSIDGWEDAARGLTINRIYNRGEILASLRSIFAIYEDPPESQGQRWVDIRYKSQWSWKTLLPIGSVHAHGMFNLACYIKEAAQIPYPSDK